MVCGFLFLCRDFTGVLVHYCFQLDPEDCTAWFLGELFFLMVSVFLLSFFFLDAQEMSTYLYNKFNNLAPQTRLPVEMLQAQRPAYR